MKDWLKNNIFAIITVLGTISGFSYDRYVTLKELKKTLLNTVKIAREETDPNKPYFERTSHDVRHTNKKQGFYWFHSHNIDEVYYDSNLDDFYLKEGISKTYLSGEKN